MLGNYGIDFIGTEDLQQSICTLLQSHGYNRIYQHSCLVAQEAVTLAHRFDADDAKAHTAALLHDIGVIIPDGKRVEFLNRFGIGVFPEEAVFPLILHQKTSRIVAQQFFHIDDSEILDAIECHTTLRARASKLDMVLFIADKLCWDQSGIPPYYSKVIDSLNESLEKGSMAYIGYLLENKSYLKVIHPWLLEAYDDLVCYASPNNTVNN